MKKVFAVLAVVLASVVATGLILGTSQPTLAASLTASNVTIDSSDGTISEVTVAPSGTVTWNNFDSTPEQIHVHVYISKGPNSKDDLVNCASEIVQIPSENQGKSGSQGFSLDTIDLTSNMYLDDWTDSTFKSDTDGKSKTASGIKIKLKVEVPDGGKTAETNTSSFDVTVNNLESSASVSGSANTGGSA